MESFYGGRPGASFIITKTFSSIDQMVSAFQQGTSYTEVYYDEYVIISVAPNETNNEIRKQNGNVYRRGYDYTNSMGGAEYIGNIKGPAGSATEIDILHFNDTSFDSAESLVQNTFSPDQLDLIPGAYKENNEWKYNDNILWKYYYFIPQDGDQRIMKIGFQIPYPVMDLEVELINADLAPTATKLQDTDQHPFFSKWKLGIPRAKKGDSIKKISLISGSHNAEVNYSNYDDSQIINNQKKADDAETDRLILVYTKVSYDAAGEELPEQIYYLGDYQIVQNIDITPEGYMRFTLPDGSTVSSQNRVIPRIIGVDLNDNGRITFKWKDTNGTESEMESDTEIQWIDDIDYTKDGNLKITWNTVERDSDGEEKRDENNNLIKNTKILESPFSSVTNVAVIDGVLYQTYLGIEKEIENFENDQQATNEETLITYQNSIYYHDIVNDVWYKKIADLSFLIKEMLVNLKVLNPNNPLPGEPYQDLGRHIVMTLTVQTKKPCAWGLEGTFVPKTPWPAYLFDNRRRSFNNRNKALLKQISTITNDNQTIYSLYLAVGGERTTGDVPPSTETMIALINEKLISYIAFYQLNGGEIRLITWGGGTENMSYFVDKDDGTHKPFVIRLGVVYNFDGTFPQIEE